MSSIEFVKKERSRAVRWLNGCNKSIEKVQIELNYLKGVRDSYQKEIDLCDHKIKRFEFIQKMKKGKL